MYLFMYLKFYSIIYSHDVQFKKVCLLTFHLRPISPLRLGNKTVACYAIKLFCHKSKINKQGFYQVKSLDRVFSIVIMSDSSAKRYSKSANFNYLLKVYGGQDNW